MMSSSQIPPTHPDDPLMDVPWGCLTGHIPHWGVGHEMPFVSSTIS